MKKTPLRPKKGKAWKRLRPINPNNKNRFVPESIIKAVDARSGGICEFIGDYGIRCTNEGQRTPHHRLKRSQGGKHTLENCAKSCPFHNDWAEREKLESIRLGWTIPYEGYTQ